MRSTSAELNAELDAGEQLLWSGQPRQGLFLRCSDAFLIPFSLMWGGFAILWETFALSPLIAGGTEKPPLIFSLLFPLFGLPFVLVGLYLIFGRFFVDRWIRQNTCYGVTNRRVIIRSGLINRSTKSLNLGALADVSLTERSNGSGTILLGTTTMFGNWLSGASSSWPGASRQAPPCLDSIPQARAVYDLIRRAQNTPGNNPA